MAREAHSNALGLRIAGARRRQEALQPLAHPAIQLWRCAVHVAPESVEEMREQDRKSEEPALGALRVRALQRLLHLLDGYIIEIFRLMDRDPLLTSDLIPARAFEAQRQNDFLQALGERIKGDAYYLSISH